MAKVKENENEYKNIHKGHRQRFRKRFINETGKNFEDHEILELLLYYCVHMKNTNEIAHKLLKDFGNLNLLFSSSPEEIMSKSGVSERVAVFLSLQNEVIKRYNEQRWQYKLTLNSSEIVGEYILSLLSYEKYEQFYLISLDAQNRLINSNLIAEGVSNEVHIYPRVIIDYALRNKATSVILAHNHPGGKCKPSFDDVQTTNNIVKVLNMIDIEVIDHIIVADNKYFSFADNGLIE